MSRRAAAMLAGAALAWLACVLRDGRCAASSGLGMADPNPPHPEEPATRASRRRHDRRPTHGWYSTTLGALSALRPALIAARNADSTSGTPAPLTPDSTMTSRLAARFSLAR